MTFTSAAFALFFPCVALVYFLVPARWQNLALLCASCVFYGFNLAGQPLSAVVLAEYDRALAAEDGGGTPAA